MHIYTHTARATATAAATASVAIKAIILVFVFVHINPHKPERIDPEVLEGTASGREAAARCESPLRATRWQYTTKLTCVRSPHMATLAHFTCKVCTVALALRARCEPSHSRPELHRLGSGGIPCEWPGGHGAWSERVGADRYPSVACNLP